MNDTNVLGIHIPNLQGCLQGILFQILKPNPDTRHIQAAIESAQRSLQVLESALKQQSENLAR